MKRTPQRILCTLLFVIGLPFFTYAAATQQDNNSLANDEVIINGEIVKISCDSPTLASDVSAMLTQIQRNDNLITEEYNQIGFDYLYSSESPIDIEEYKERSRLRRERFAKLMSDRNWQEQLLYGYDKKILGGFMGQIVSEISNFSGFKTITNALLVNEHIQVAREKIREIDDEINALRTTENAEATRIDAIAIGYGKANPNSRIIRLQKQNAELKASIPRIGKICSSQKPSVRPVYEFPDAPEIKKPQRGNPVIRAEIDRLQKAHDATPEFRANPPKPCGIECMPERADKLRKRLGNPLIRDALNPPQYFPC